MEQTFTHIPVPPKKRCSSLSGPIVTECETRCIGGRIHCLLRGSAVVRDGKNVLTIETSCASLYLISDEQHKARTWSPSQSLSVCVAIHDILFLSLSCLSSRSLILFLPCLSLSVCLIFSLLPDSRVDLKIREKKLLFNIVSVSVSTQCCDILLTCFVFYILY